jgi:thioredoxin 1
MLNRRRMLAALLLAVAMSWGSDAFAIDRRPFDAKAFDAAVAAGRSVIVEVHAPWCPVCRAQAPTIARVTSGPKFKNAILFVVDFDSQKDALRKLNVHKQSTLIAYKGKQEITRSTGESNPAAVEAILNRAI